RLLQQQIVSGAYFEDRPYANFIWKLIDGKLYASGTMSNYLATAVIDTSNLSVIKLHIPEFGLQQYSRIFAVKNYSVNKRVVLERKGTSLQVRMTDAYK